MEYCSSSQYSNDIQILEVLLSVFEYFQKSLVTWYFYITSKII